MSKSDILTTAFLAIILGASMLVDTDIKPAPNTRYHVVSEQDGLPLYLAFVDHGKGMQTAISHMWVIDESMAWKYGSLESAQFDADRYGGVPMPMRATQ